MAGGDMPKLGTPPTHRELQVLWLKAHGLSNAEVGRRMNLHPLTVKAHLARAARRLRSENTAHSVAICMRDGLLPLRGYTVANAPEMAAAAVRAGQRRGH